MELCFLPHVKTFNYSHFLTPISKISATHPSTLKFPYSYANRSKSWTLKCAKGSSVWEIERKLEDEMSIIEDQELVSIGRLTDKCKGEGGMVELLECLEREAIMGEDEGKEPMDYNRRAQIFDKSSRVFQALKEREATSGKAATLQLIMDTLRKYEDNSGQLINKEKSCFLMDKEIPAKRKHIVARNLNFQEKEFPIKYLGCPLFYGRKKIEFFTEMDTKIIQRVESWHANLLSTSGKKTLYQACSNCNTFSLDVYLPTTKYYFSQIEIVFANFFWGNLEGKQKYHWSSWKNLCLPIEEGGIGIRTLQEILDTFSAKLWWQFRTRESLWTDFMKAKYS
uniref:Uncharacterized protein n=1 Tax=Nicotiana tabacum TaxID=4097 RepID=A0A1S4C762_TOBAC|nr:PREDICTED: uncharacterized protein LOC107815849 [Nicotiana tabacum]